MTGVNHLSGLTIFGDCAGQLDMLPLFGATVVCFQLLHENERGHLNAHPHQSLQNKMTCPYGGEPISTVRWLHPSAPDPVAPLFSVNDV